MAENFASNIETLLKSMDGYLHTKTVVGEPVEVGENIVLPLAEVSFGIGAGAFEGKDSKGGGGMGAKISPSAVLVINDGGTKLVSVKESNPMSKVMDMVPDLLNKFTGKEKEKAKKPEE